MDSKKLEHQFNHWIQDHQKLGENSSSSGHLSYLSYKVDSIEPPFPIVGTQPPEYLVTFAYHILTETEFTYLPDNPPSEYPAQGQIRIDEYGNLIEREIQKNKGKKNINQV